MPIARHLLASFRFAERGGFEPPKPFWGLLAFQAGQFNHSCIFPFVAAKIALFVKSCNSHKPLLFFEEYPNPSSLQDRKLDLLPTS